MNVFIGGSDRNEAEEAKDRKERSIVEDVVCGISEERYRVLENRTDAQDCCCLDHKCLVFRENVFNSIILEHHPNTKNTRNRYTKLHLNFLKRY
jgi:hypothetical protein